jgi:hypothetical protein
MPPAYCPRCGNPTDGPHTAARPAEDLHAACAQALALEPPRYCAACRRRMVVQVTPTGWTARCAEHGVSDNLS